MTGHDRSQWRAPTPRQKQAYALRCDGLTLAQIGGEMGIGAEAVRQLLAKAERKAAAAAKLAEQPTG